MAPRGRQHVSTMGPFAEQTPRQPSPFADGPANVGCMTDPERPRLFRKKVIRPYRSRGDVYSWLRAHHAQVSEMAPTWSWADLVREMLRDGLQGRYGVTPTPKAVTKVWQRVCRDVAAETAAAKPKRKFPSRVSPEWRPQVVPPPPIRPSFYPPSSISDVAGAHTQAAPADDDMTPEGQAMLDRIRAELRDDDRKRFRF